MNATIDTLTRFNRQVLQCQDEAYTLAWYLLGDAAQAEAVTQAAVIEAYRSYTTQGGNSRRLILKQVLRQCQRAARQTIPVTGGSPAGAETDSAEYARLILTLPEPERQALVLIEVLGLSYAEASAIAGISTDAVRKNLTQALRKIHARQGKAEVSTAAG